MGEGGDSHLKKFSAFESMSGVSKRCTLPKWDLPFKEPLAFIPTCLWRLMCLKSRLAGLEGTFSDILSKDSESRRKFLEYKPST